jgi:hypothetical protein
MVKAENRSRLMQLTAAKPHQFELVLERAEPFGRRILLEPPSAASKKRFRGRFYCNA